MRKGVCIHYVGFFDYQCKAGVNYKEAFGGDPDKMPCVKCIEIPHRKGPVNKPIDRHGKQEIPCPFYQEPSDEEVARFRERRKKRLDYIRAAMAAVRHFRVTPAPEHEVHGIVKCPACGGNLHFYQSAHNGHGRGVCETEDCIGWME